MSVLNKVVLATRDAIIKELQDDLDNFKRTLSEEYHKVPYIDGQFRGREESIKLIKLKFRDD